MCQPKKSSPKGCSHLSLSETFRQNRPFYLKNLAKPGSRGILLVRIENGSRIADVAHMFEANLLYFEVQGNEWFFRQRIKERGFDVLIAKSASGIIGLAQTGEVLSV